MTTITTTTNGNSLPRMNPDDRLAFLQNVLVSKKIIEITKDEDETDTSSDIDDQTTVKSTIRTTSMVVEDLVDTKTKTKIIGPETCSICLIDYAENDILCWSQNSRCRHYFHRDCAIQWFMKHEECPLCRNNYLSLDDEGEEEINLPSRLQIGSSSRSRTGPNQLQPVVDSPTIPIMPLETIELPDTRLGNTETISDSGVEVATESIDPTLSTNDELPLPEELP